MKKGAKFNGMTDGDEEEVDAAGRYEVCMVENEEEGTEGPPPLGSDSSESEDERHGVSAEELGELRRVRNVAAADCRGPRCSGETWSWMSNLAEERGELRRMWNVSVV